MKPQSRSVTTPPEVSSDALSPQETEKPPIRPSQSADEVRALDHSQTQGFEAIQFVVMNPEILRESKIIYRPLVLPGARNKSPENIRVSLEHYNLFLLKNRKSCPVSICSESISNEQSPLIVFTDKSGKILATIQSWWQTRMGGMFSLYRFSGAQGNETLLWSVHTGGADLSFDHFRIELNPSGKLRINTDFVRTIGEEHLDVRGQIDIFRSNSEILDLSEMRGSFLSLPQELVPERSFADLIEDSKFKNAAYMSAIPVWSKMAKSGEAELVLMQIDAPRITFNPLWAERFIYKAIEWSGSSWNDASHRPAAQAFYRAAEKDLFRELSRYDGAVRNWMLGTWASYKALLGEWDEAKEVLRVKADTKAYKEQICEVSALLSKNPEGGIYAAKMLSFIEFQAKRKIPRDPRCEPPALVDFLEKEMLSRGMIPAQK